MVENDLISLWNKVLAEFKNSVSTTNYLSLFKSTRLFSLDDDIATLAVPNPMVYKLLTERFLPQLTEVFGRLTGKEISVMVIQKTVSKKKPKTETQAPLFEEMGEDQESGKNPPASFHKEGEFDGRRGVVRNLPRVREDYTFSSFAVSGGNQLAFVSAQKVAKSIGFVYNPFFIYGPVGVGKTHLMHAIANDAYQKDSTRKIIYITSEEFTNEVIEAIRNNDTSRMKKKFRGAYLLLIDDIQFIAGKDKVQEELFHTFNILIDNRSQICLTSDRPPHEIQKLEARLSSRFAGGLTVDIEAPGLELKTAIAQKKAEKMGYRVSTEVGMLLAENSKDTRALEGLLLRVVSLAVDTVEITMEVAQKALGKVIEEAAREGEGRVYPGDVITYVCSHFHVKATALKGPKRDASLVKARQVAMYLLKIRLGLPHAEIGNLLGGRDHTTVMHGVEKMENLVDNKAEVSEDIMGITKGLWGEKAGISPV